MQLCQVDGDQDPAAGASLVLRLEYGSHVSHGGSVALGTARSDSDHDLESTRTSVRYDPAPCAGRVADVGDQVAYRRADQVRLVTLKVMTTMFGDDLPAGG
jgi:hypothetical protein